MIESEGEATVSASPLEIETVLLNWWLVWSILETWSASSFLSLIPKKLSFPMQSVR